MGTLETAKKIQATQRIAEMNAGRRHTTIAMMEGVIEQLCKDCNMDKRKVSLVTSHEDCREWVVIVELAPGVKHTESLWVFPTLEARTMMMLTQK